MTTEHPTPNPSDLSVTEQEEEHFRNIANAAPLSVELGIKHKNHSPLSPLAMASSLMDLINTVPNVLATGNEHYNDWVREAVRAHFNGEPIPKFPMAAVWVDVGHVSKFNLDNLFEFIRHGDDEHESWLCEALNAFFTNHVKPEYVPSKKDKIIENVVELFRLHDSYYIDTEHFLASLKSALKRVLPPDFVSVREVLPFEQVTSASDKKKDLVLLGWRIDWPDTSKPTIGNERWCGLDAFTRKDRHVGNGAVAVELWGDPTKKPSSGPPEQKKYCKECSTQRAGDICHRCGTELFVADPRWEEPPIPGVDPIRAAAKTLGYAIGEHGSRERDLDLIAVPWSKDAQHPAEFVVSLASLLGGRVLETEDKEAGRFAVTIQLDGFFKPIDLSVMGPRTEQFFYGSVKSQPMPPGPDVTYNANLNRSHVKVNGVPHVYTPAQPDAHYGEPDPYKPPTE
jgi:hypothetical protein